MNLTIEAPSKSEPGRSIPVLWEGRWDRDPIGVATVRRADDGLVLDVLLDARSVPVPIQKAVEKGQVYASVGQVNGRALSVSLGLIPQVPDLDASPSFLPGNGGLRVEDPVPTPRAARLVGTVLAWATIAVLVAFAARLVWTAWS